MAVWLEVALNGGAGRKLQPNIPVTPDQIIQDGVRCFEAGAAVLHIHVYDETGKPTENADVYSVAIEGLRKRTDAIIYPTLMLQGTVAERFASIETLGERGLLEWTVVDPGSVNITHNAMLAQGRNGFLYANPDDHLRRGLALAEKFGLHPSYAIYEPGFAREGAALAAQFPKMPQPIYRLMLSSDFTFGLPPAVYSLDAYQQLLADVAPDAPWMVASLGGDVMQIAEASLDRGAHLRVGLEDASLGCEKTNVELVEEAVALIEKSGRNLANVGEVRAELTGRNAA
jgi:uncharacterized protein (DUF849 family)